MRFLSAASQKVSRALPATLLKYSVLMVVYLHDSHFSVLGTKMSSTIEAFTVKSQERCSITYIEFTLDSTQAETSARYVDEYIR